MTVLLVLAAPAFAQEDADARLVKPRADMPAGQPPTDSGTSMPTPQAAETLGPAEHAAFAEAVDVSAFSKLAVFDAGRVKIVDTLAREQLQRIYGKERWRSPWTGRKYDPTFTYLDLLLHPEYYDDKPLVHVDVLPLRRRLVEHLPEGEREFWLKVGRLSPQLLGSPQAANLLMGRDIEPGLFGAQQATLQAVMHLDAIGGRLRLVSPGPGGEKWTYPWAGMDHDHTGEPPDAHAGEAEPADAEAAAELRSILRELGPAWRAGEAGEVNELLDRLVATVPTVNPQSYPARSKLTLEWIYNFTHRFTLGYLAYAAGTLALLLAFATTSKWLFRTGGVLLGVGFLVHTAGIVVRAVLTGRWPIHNQFESFVAITWFAVLVGLIFMFARRQGLFGAAAGALGTCALLVANMMDIPSSGMGRDMPILATSQILYVHVNVVLASYALIGLGFFISLWYLLVHYFAGPGGGAGGGGGDGVVRFAAAGLGQIDSDTGEAATDRSAMLNGLDRAQMVVLQLAFWLLGLGILLGAYWADHAWGRWWGWDPKETWALITWIIYLIAIHTRFSVRRRGLVTAWLSVIGFFIMLWTYWGVNLLLAGLHSYA
ncbi:MAG: cytochrome c biogenesis protein CcsA [Phycisphaeraceae bacterium]